MSRRNEGDSRQTRSFETFRPYYETRQKTDEIRRRAEQEEKKEKETTKYLKSKYNLLFAKLHQLKIKRINAVHNDTRLNSRYNLLIASPNFQELILFSQELYLSGDTMSRYRNDLTDLHNIQSNIAKYSDLRDKYINDCQKYNKRAEKHNRNACEENKVESIDIEGAYKLDPFTPSNLDLSPNGLRRAVKDLRRNEPQ